MALIKEIELDNGVVVRYHRIVSINKITNNCNLIEVASYTTEDKRKEEIEKLSNGEEMNIFINTNYINVPYNEEQTIKQYYDYLKTTDMFKDATDNNEVNTLSINKISEKSTEE